MRKTSPARRRAVLKTSVATAVLGAAFLTSPAVFAQDQAQETETIVVTGSRIARPDLRSSSPLAVVGQEEFTLSGATNVESVLNVLPQVIPGETSFSNNPGEGVATVDLRGLEEERTLVLVNGRRYIFYDVAQVVDINNIPTFLVERVDVVTGGASAVYGSDAIAGVVNFMLRRDFEGAEVGATYRLTERGDGERVDFNIALGTNFADDRGNILAYANYYDRKAIYQDARRFSRTALVDDVDEAGNPILSPGGTSVVPGGRVTIPEDARPAIFPGGLGALFQPGGTFRPFVSPGDQYNYAPANLLMVPQERWLIGSQAHYDITDSIRVYMEATFANNRVAGELAPTPFGENVAIDADSPFLAPSARAAFLAADALETGDDAGDGYVNATLFRRMSEAGPRENLDERNAWRVVGGLEGDVIEGWKYDAYYLFARTRNSQIQNGNISISRMRSALRTELDPDTGELRCADAAARDQGCVPINVFGEGALSQEAVDYVSIAAANSEISQLQVASGSVTGELFDLGAGPVGLALGAEWRSVSSRFLPDFSLASGDVSGFNAGAPTSGRYSVKEIFGELRAPLVANEAFADRLELTAAARYSDYSLDAVGGVFTWAAGAEWAPIADVTLRGQFQRAIRAPNVEELFGGQEQGFPPAIDPCSDRSPETQTPAVRALCEATGVPVGSVFTGGVQPDSQIEGSFGGNPDLEEEKSDTWTLGVVVQPAFAPGLNVTLDYYNIKVDNYITDLGGGVNNILSLCYTVIQDINHPYCQAVQRNPGGDIDIVVANRANVASLKTAGIDFQVDYGLDLNFGLFDNESRLNFFFLGTWVEKWTYQPVTELPDKIDCVGQFGATCDDPIPEFRFTSRLTWSTGPMQLSLRYRWVDKLKDDQIKNADTPASDLAKPTLGAHHYFDLAAVYDVNEDVQVSFGVNNLFDNKPPLTGDSQEQANTFPGLYDVLGRDYFLSATVRF
ncbi:MAG TPA: TonB-dependent receptor [Pedomonas sp.]|uniref:TonB-dependent receptor n=1 Tax=Pedomonas sp. TaxID=2976421 RepID=UPI002F40C30E